MSSWAGSFRPSATVIVPAASPYTAIQGELVLVDTTLGPVTVKAPATPEFSTAFGVTFVNDLGSDVTIDGNGSLLLDLKTRAAVTSFAYFEPFASSSYFFDGTVYHAGNNGSAIQRPLNFSPDIHAAGTKAIQPFDLERYDPAAGGMQIDFPPLPYFGMRVGIKNLTFDTTAITINGNGFNLQSPQAGGIPVASFVTAVPRAQAGWEFDGTEWILVDVGIAFGSTIGNFAEIVRPETVTLDVNYLGTYSDITTPYTAETDGLGLAADFTAGTITSSITTRLKDIRFQGTLGSNNGTRTDVTIAKNGTPIGAPFTGTGSGLPDPGTMIAEAMQVDVVPGDILTAQVRNDHPSHTIRWWALELVAVQL